MTGIAIGPFRNASNSRAPSGDFEVALTAPPKGRIELKLRGQRSDEFDAARRQDRRNGHYAQFDVALGHEFARDVGVRHCDGLNRIFEPKPLDHLRHTGYRKEGDGFRVR